jgi:co-chaperonin GroES (HSP10)
MVGSNSEVATIMRIIRSFCVCAALTVLGSLLGARCWAQGEGTGGQNDVTATHVLGEVVRIEAGGAAPVVKTSLGEVTVAFAEAVQFLRVRPGEKTLEKAETITLADVQVGDRVLARGKVSADRKSVTARQFIVMSKSAIAQKQEREREDWRRRGVSGAVTAVDATKREIIVRTYTPEGPKPMTISAGDKTVFRRYAPDSVKFADAKASSFEVVKVGNQVRALGDRDDAGERMRAEVVVSGEFVMAGGPIKAVNSQAGTVLISDLATKKDVTVVTNDASVLRRLPEQLATMMARRAQMMAGGGSGAGSPFGAGMRPGGGEGGMGPSGGRAAAGAGGAGSAGTAASGAGAGPGADGQRRRMAGGDLSEMLQRLPPLKLAELKVGDVILVSSTKSADPARVTAILLAAGVEPLLTQPPPGANGVVDSANMTFPSGVLDMGMGFP